MNPRTLITLAGSACVLALASPLSASAQNYPASPEAQASGAAPSPAYVWMGGQWNSEGGQWKWVAAHWELPPARNAVWVAGHWAPADGKWTWVNGAWNVGDAPQSQSAPPQPPGEPAPSQMQAGAQGVPMPSTPAPYIDGQYGPGGVSRVIDQPPVTTDYGPVEYDAPAYYPSYYPGGYWAGDPWFWGAFPIGYLGFGWGHGYYGRGGYHGGWGHGGWGHGGHGYAGHAGYGGHAGGHTH